MTKCNHMNNCATCGNELAAKDARIAWLEGQIYEKDIEARRLIALASFLAAYQRDLNKLRYSWIAQSPEDCRQSVIGQWPMIQGTSNQIHLQRIGEMKTDSKDIPLAVKSIMKKIKKNQG